jgi:hypothetical protein
MRSFTAVLAAALTLVACARPLHAAGDTDSVRRHGSSLALPRLAGQRTPDLILAQRTIERRWGPSEDSTYHEINAPGWKSESGALAMSFAVPGTGQLYAGERSGYLFMIGEAVGIFEVWELTRSGNRWERKARGYAGDPNDSTSRWSFDTYEQHTGANADQLRALFRADPGLFYAEIANDPSLRYGWADNGAPNGELQQYSSWRGNAEERRRHSRTWRAAVLVNHLASAFDALRAARLVNLPIQRNMELHLKSGWSGGGPELAAVIERRF